MGHRPLQSCLVPGCGFGQHRYRLCYKHSHAWDKAGRPAVDRWKPEVAGTPAAVCAIPGCALWAELDAGWCHSHHARWRQRGRPSTAEFIAYCASYGEDRFDLRPLAAAAAAGDRLRAAMPGRCEPDPHHTPIDQAAAGPSGRQRRRVAAGASARRLAGRTAGRGRTVTRRARSSATPSSACSTCATGPAGTANTSVTCGGCAGSVSPATTVPGWISLRCNHCGCGSWPNDGAAGACRAVSGWGSCARTASRWCGCRG